MSPNGPSVLLGSENSGFTYPSHITGRLRILTPRNSTSNLYDMKSNNQRCIQAMSAITSQHQQLVGKGISSADAKDLGNRRTRFQRSSSARVSAEDQESSMAKFCRRLNSLESAVKRGKLGDNKDMREASIEDDQDVSTPVADLVKEEKKAAVVLLLKASRH